MVEHFYFKTEATTLHIDHSWFHLDFWITPKPCQVNNFHYVLCIKFRANGLKKVNNKGCDGSCGKFIPMPAGTPSKTKFVGEVIVEYSNTTKQAQSWAAVSIFLGMGTMSKPPKYSLCYKTGSLVPDNNPMST